MSIAKRHFKKRVDFFLDNFWLRDDELNWLIRKKFITRDRALKYKRRIALMFKEELLKNRHYLGYVKNQMELATEGFRQYLEKFSN